MEHSVITRGCVVEGAAENSVLSENSCIEEGASVEYSILMPGAVVKKGATVAYAIIGENTVIGENAVIGARPDGSEGWGITVVGPEVDVPKAYKLAANHMLNKNLKEVAR